MKLILLSLLILSAFSGLSYACPTTESGVPPCAYWTRADAVFLGKILTVEKVSSSEDLPAGARKIRFQILQNFKGADNPTFAVITKNAKTDGGLTAKKGETWIIYARNDIVVKSFAEFRGVRIEPKETSGELEILKNIINGKSGAAISGRLAGKGGKYSFAEAEVSIEGKNFRQTAKTDADGAFNFDLPSEGKYKVVIKFPFRAKLVWDEALLGTAFTEGDPSIFKYDVSLNDGDCHFSFFEVSKK